MCIPRFRYRKVGGKDPLTAADDLFRGSVDYILGADLPGGGWSFAEGDPETDITAMALQALAKYRDRQDVADAVERGQHRLVLHLQWLRRGCGQHLDGG